MKADGALPLDDLAAEFADKLTALTQGVLGDHTPRFHAVNMGARIRVAPISDSQVVQHIPISVNGDPRLRLMVCYYCCWDGSSTFLATDQADIHLFYDTVTDPLIRYEYVRKSKEPPGAHLQVHAHRDELAYLLRLADAGRPGRGLKHDKLPRLSELHFPVGGHRMRPSLEDVLLFLEREFAIDTVPGWRAVVEEHLMDWRVTQLKASVRDAPDAAAEVLRTMGYVVESPRVPAARPAPGSVKLYWA
ncbi:hypothetical protein [Streptomyces sp. NPDC088258]|uniref:hypothetical protein n=1 Tax=Streptomyces sp. NPDC088258 TaxID=3365849 RepID=UPI003814F58F